jgi:dipeptide/tripeptide permease
MNKWKITFLSVLGVVDAIILAISIGYLVMAIKTPDSLAGRDIFFTGSYLIFIGYLLVFALITTVLAVLLVKWRKKDSKKQS